MSKPLTDTFSVLQAVLESLLRNNPTATFGKYEAKGCMRSHTIKPLLTIIMALVVTAQARSQGVLILQHQGSTDPTTEGFDLSIYTGGAVGPTNNDLGTSAWMTALLPGSGTLGYSQSLTPQQQTALAGTDWSLSVSLQVVQSAGTFGHIVADLNTGSQWFQLWFGSESDGDPFVRVGGSTQSPVYVLDGAGSTYNTYQLAYDASSEAASLWVNGIEVMNHIAGMSPNQSSLLAWGIAQSGSAAYQANWSFVSLEAVPEPSSLALLLVAGGVVFLRSRTSGLAKPAALTAYRQNRYG